MCQYKHYTLQPVSCQPELWQVPLVIELYLINRLMPNVYTLPGEAQGMYLAGIKLWSVSLGRWQVCLGMASSVNINPT